jgi:hypothetical protein
MIGGFKLAVGAVRRIGLVVEAAVGEGTTEPFVKEQEQEGDLKCLLRRAGRHTVSRRALAARGLSVRDPSHSYDGYGSRGRLATLDIIQLEGMKPFANFAAEVARSQNSARSDSLGTAIQRERTSALNTFRGRYSLCLIRAAANSQR